MRFKDEEAMHQKPDEFRKPERAAAGPHPARVNHMYGQSHQGE